MRSRTNVALNILQQEGPVSLGKKTTFFLAQQTSVGRKFLYEQSMSQIRDRMKYENDLEDILDTVLDIKPGYPPYQVYTMQLRDEISTLSNKVKKQQPLTVLEIGTAKGGSFYIWSRYLDSVDNLISLDLPGGKFGGGYDAQKTNIFKQFSTSKNMDFVRQDSHKISTYNKIRDISDGSVDFLFIDGDHTYEGVKQDFEMYSELVSDGGIIALHDIVTHPNDEKIVKKRHKNLEGIERRHLQWGSGHPDCNVDQFWDELVEKYDTEEIISHPKQSWAGIGIVHI